MSKCPQTSVVTSAGASSRRGKSRRAAVPSILLLLSLGLSCFGLNSTARSNFLMPSGNPTGPATADSPSNLFGYYQVSLNPGMAGLVPPNNWLAPALSAQSMDAAHGWTINYFHPAGDFQLDTYLAFTETAPAVTEPTIRVAAETRSGAGGAALGVHYTGADGQHWIQVIRDNNPISGAVTASSPTDPGFYYYIDNVGNPAGNPFYDPIGKANATDFIDRPSAPYNSSFVEQFQTFIATGNVDPVTRQVTDKTLNIADEGVYWGFKDPLAASEPSTLALALSGGVVLLLGRRLRRSA